MVTLFVALIFSTQLGRLQNNFWYQKNAVNLLARVRVYFTLDKERKGGLYLIDALGLHGGTEQHFCCLHLKHGILRSGNIASQTTQPILY